MRTSFINLYVKLTIYIRSVNLYVEHSTKPGLGFKRNVQNLLVKTTMLLYLVSLLLMAEPHLHAAPLLALR